MKKTLLLTFIIAIYFNTISQINPPKPPYPILFVHGWMGSDTGWTKESFSWKEHLESFGWKDGGIIDVCLESQSESLHDAADVDVELIGNRINSSISGDFYFINFDVKSNGDPYPDLEYQIQAINPLHLIDATTEYLYFYFLNSGDIEDIAQGDILEIYHYGDIFLSEFVEVISVEDNRIRVERGKFETVALNWSSLLMNSGQVWANVKNHSNLSNQAAIVKGGKGVKVAIDRIKEITNTDKVVLIAHSMGGLNCREYIQSDDYENDVIKLITISSPHQGSNLSDLGNLLQLPGKDTQSDAVRDMRFSTDFNLLDRAPSDNDNAPYLFGESVSESDFNWELDLHYYSKDFNADGSEESTEIFGLNRKPWREEVLLHCIITTTIPTQNDGVVRADRQIPPDNIFSSPLFVDTTQIRLSEFQVNWKYKEIFAHMACRKAIEEGLRGLDEPDRKLFAFEIQVSEINPILYNGLITYRPNWNSSDQDWYKFTSVINGEVSLSVLDLPSPNSWEISIENEDGSEIELKTNNDGDPVLVKGVELGQTYYLKISSRANSESWKNPYTFFLQYQNEYETPYLSDGHATPIFGNTATNFEFKVKYFDENPNTNGPNEVQVIIDGVAYSMEKDGNDDTFNNGVEYTYSSTFDEVKTYYYSYNAIESSYPDIKPFPQDESSLNFYVQESSEGWEAEIEPANTTYSPAAISPGTNITVNVGVRNSGENAYASIPLRVELRDPDGELVDFSEINEVVNLTPNNSGIYTTSLYLPSGSSNGSFSIHSFIMPALDTDGSNNSHSNYFNIGENLSNEQFRTNNGLETLELYDNLNINGQIFYLESINLSSYFARFREPDGSSTNVYMQRVEIFGSYDSFIGCDGVWEQSGTRYAQVYGAHAISNGASYDNLDIYGHPGGRAYAYANAPSGFTFESDDDEYELFSSSTTSIKNWYDNISRVGSYDRIEIEFDIPDEAPLGRTTLYFMTPYSGNDTKDFTRLNFYISNPPPILSSMSSNSISTDDEITLSGSGFGFSGTIRFNDVIATNIVSWSNTSITCVVPEGIDDGTVTVNNSNGTSNSLSYTVIYDDGTPFVSNPIPDQSINPGDTKFIADLNNVFTDPNGLELSFSANSSNSNISIDTEQLQSGNLQVVADQILLYSSEITITATDPSEKSFSYQFTLNVSDILEIDPYFQSVEAESGLITYSVHSNLDWSVSTNSNWFTVEKTNDNLITVTFDENLSVNDRTESIIVTAEGASPRTALISQDGAEPFVTSSSTDVQIGAGSGSLDLVINSNTTWAASSNADWLNAIKADDHTLTLQYDSNPETEARTALVLVTVTGGTSVEITVTQEAGNYTLIVNPTTINLLSESGDSEQFEVTSNINWTANYSADWFTVSPSEGDGDATVTVMTLSENPAIDTRTAIITLSGTGVNSQIVTANQAGSEPILTVDPTSLTLGAESGSFDNFIITSNVNWSISGVPDWLTISLLDGVDDATISVTANSNNPSVTETRTATITISGGELTEEVRISQEPGTEIILTVDPTTLNLGQESGSNANFAITSNTNWTISVSDTWLNVSLVSGSGDETITVTAISTNTSNDTRTAIVTISAGELIRTIEVIQSGQESFITVTSPENNSVWYTGETYEITWTDNFPEDVQILLYDGTSFQPIIQPTESDGSHFWEIPENLESGDSYQIRMQSIASSTYDYSEHFTILAPPELIIEPSSITLEQESGSNASFTITSNVDWTVSADESWLNVSSTEGADNGEVTVTANSANTSIDARSATVTITGGGLTRTIEVTQTGHELSITVTSPISSSIWYPGETYEITWTDNFPENVQILLYDGTDFQSIIQSTESDGFHFWTIPDGLPDGDLYQIRMQSVERYIYDYSDYFTILTLPELETSPATISLGAESGSFDNISVTSNVNWAVSDNATWLDVSPDNGEDDGTITVTANSENPSTTNSRTATVTITGGGLSEEVTVTQEPLTETILTVSPTSIMLDPEAGSSAAFTITSNVNWSVTNDAGWLEISLESGSSNATVTITTFTANTSIDQRTAAISISGGGITRTILVIQLGVEPSLTVISPTSNSIWYIGSTYEIRWENNFSENVQILLYDGTDFYPVIQSTESDGSYFYTVPEGLASGSNYQIRIQRTTSYVYDYSEYFTILERPRLTVEPTYITLNSAVGSNDIFNISSNVSWTISDDASWLDVSQTSGTGDATVTVTANSENPSTINSRIAMVTISADDITRTVTITQDPNTGTELEVSPERIYLDPEQGSSISFFINSNVSWSISDDVTWLDVQPSAGSGNAEITITTSVANNSIEERVALITVIGGGLTRTVEVIQLGVEPEIFVTSPKSGDIWYIGSTYEIIWQDNFPENVQILLYDGNDFYPIVQSTESDGSYFWTVPDGLTPGGSYQIRIQSTTRYIYDYSDYFTIQERPILTANPASLILGSASGANGTIEITTNVSWIADTDATWLELSPSSGAGNGTVTISAISDNPSTTETRLATVTFTGGGISTEVTITQESSAVSKLTVTPTSLMLKSANGSNSSFEISSNVNWSINCDKDWLDVSPTDGSEDGTITVTANSENEGTESRTSIVTVRSEGADPAVVTVTQEAKGANITIISPNGGESLEVGKTHTLKWESENVSKVTIAYSINNGTDWESIVNDYNSTGTYDWAVTKPESNQCRVKISSSTDSEIFDISESVFFIYGPSGINNMYSNLKFKIYPNPTFDVINLLSSENIEKNVLLKVTDVSGNQVLIHKFDQIRSDMIYKIDISKLNHGIYYLQISNSKLIRIEKVIKY